MCILYMSILSEKIVGLFKLAMIQCNNSLLVAYWFHSAQEICWRPLSKKLFDLLIVFYLLLHKPVTVNQTFLLVSNYNFKIFLNIFLILLCDHPVEQQEVTKIGSLNCGQSSYLSKSITQELVTGRTTRI